MKKTLLTICSLLVDVSSMTVGDLEPKNGNLQQIKSKDLIQSTGSSCQGSGSSYNSDFSSYKYDFSNFNSCYGGIRSYYWQSSNDDDDDFGTSYYYYRGDRKCSSNYNSRESIQYDLSNYNSCYGGIRSSYSSNDKGTSYYYYSGDLRCVNSYNSGSSSYAFYTGKSYNSQYGGVRSYYWYNGRDNSQRASYYYYSGDRNSSSSYNSGSSSYKSGSSYNSYRPSSYNSYRPSGNNSNRRNSSNNSNSTNSTIVFQDRSYTPISTAYTDTGSGSSRDLVVTKISKVKRNCFSLGHYAQASYSEPQKEQMHRYCTNAKHVFAVFRKPVSFTKGWDDTGVEEVTNASFWIPNCPRGFRALGSLAVRIPNGNTPTSRNFPEFRCIAAKFAQRAKYSNLIWTDSGSGGRYDAKIWSIIESPFFMSGGLNKELTRTIYKLETSIKGKGF